MSLLKILDLSLNVLEYLGLYIGVSLLQSREENSYNQEDWIKHRRIVTADLFKRACTFEMITSSFNTLDSKIIVVTMNSLL